MLKKGEVYKLGEPFAAAFGEGHGWLWMCEGVWRRNVDAAFSRASVMVSAWVRDRPWEIHSLKYQSAGGFRGKPGVVFVHHRRFGLFRSVLTGQAYEFPDFAVTEGEPDA
jgi:hypothetical protein